MQKLPAFEENDLLWKRLPRAVRNGLKVKFQQTLIRGTTHTCRHVHHPTTHAVIFMCPNATLAHADVILNDLELLFNVEDVQETELLKNILAALIPVDALQTLAMHPLKVRIVIRV